jgi:catechol 2,3-dioxygenase
LLAELDDTTAEPFEGLPDGTIVGHTHLRVADVPSTIAFYRDVIGFPLMAALRDMAAFHGAGGYHHHVGANVWESAGATPAPAGTATLRHATILLPDAAERDRVAARVAGSGQEPEPRDDGVLVRDPSGNALLLGIRGR